MRILIVSSGNSGQLAPFVKEQTDALNKFRIEFGFYNITGKGTLGYLLNLRSLWKFKRTFKPDIIHAHYGLSGLLALLVKGNSGLIVTFHGNDINPLHPFDRFKPNLNKLLARVVYLFGNYSIFVTDEILTGIKASEKKSVIIPCQVNLDTFIPVENETARRELNLSLSKRYVLFSSSFRNYIKNYPLARQACEQVGEIELIELDGFTRREVNLLLNACDVAMITSFNEGSCQFMKEAMACNRPIVSTKVGDSEWLFGSIEGCYITSFDPSDVAKKLKLALEFSLKNGKTNGRQRIIELGLDSDTIACRVYDVYKKVLNQE